MGSNTVTPFTTNKIFFKESVKSLERNKILEKDSENFIKSWRTHCHFCVNLPSTKNTLRNVKTRSFSMSFLGTKIHLQISSVTVLRRRKKNITPLDVCFIF